MRIPVQLSPRFGLGGLLAIAFLLASLQGVESLRRILQLTAEQKELLSHMSIVYLDDGTGNLVSKTLRITRLNLQLVNGLGATNGLPSAPNSTDPLLTQVNGVGNFLVGYNELGNPNSDRRDGSHNLVIGHGNSYRSFGGVSGSQDNEITDAFASVVGGSKNSAIATQAVISGGTDNEVSGLNSVVTAGQSNRARVFASSVTGGRRNNTNGSHSTVSGGYRNRARAPYASVLGGARNFANASSASVSGGLRNDCTAGASISGGRYNDATASASSICGGSRNHSKGVLASISGGKNNVSGDDYFFSPKMETSILGGEGNSLLADRSSISGGRFNMTGVGFPPLYSWATVSGGYNNCARGYFGVVGGGSGNYADRSGTVCGGELNVGDGSISGGRSNVAGYYFSGTTASVNGGRDNAARGSESTVSGGDQRRITGANDWAAGSLFEDN